MKTKTIIIIIAVLIVLIFGVTYFLGSSNKRKAKKDQEDLRDKAKEDKLDPTKSTFTNEEGKQVRVSVIEIKLKRV